jgi:2-oxoglutarate dehydrogenase E2 component (dihydrolipoamide succinyltransferase)
MGVSVAEGTIVAWKKAVGDEVQADEPIVEISTDKVETEIPSPASGRLAEVLVEPGVTVDVGTVLARIETADRRPLTAEPEPVAPAPTTNGHSVRNGSPPISPVVRRMADEHDIDLTQIAGSGRLGRVTKRDVLAFLRNRDEGIVEEAPPAPVEATLHIESPYVEEPAPTTEHQAPSTLSLMRRQIGDHMVRSLQTAAHCTTVVEADMSAVEAARGRLSYLPFVARATIAALREYPMLNATLEGERFTVHESVNLGIAVSLGENGLIVPVIKDAHELSHEGLATRIKDLAERARSKRLTPDEVQGGTFTITNPGAFGALLATPIINQPQVAILDLEAVTKRPVVVNGDSIAIRPMTYLCMSWDHRALDGALAAQFLSSVRSHLEEWSG